MTLHQKIIELLNSNNIKYTETHHKPVFTSEEAAKIRGSKLEDGAKALLFSADNEYIQIVIQGNRKVDKDKFKSTFGFNKLKMISAEEVKKVSGVEPGAVPPFGNLFSPPIKVYCNNGFGDMIEFNAGDHRVSIHMNFSDWSKIVNPIFGNYGER